MPGRFGRGRHLGYGGGLAALICTIVSSVGMPGAAWAGDQPTYGPPEPWVKPIAIPTAGAAPDGAPAQLLLYDLQGKLSTEGDAFFVDKASKILSPQGLGAVGTLTETWDPDTEDLVIHTVHVIRDGAVIDALAGGQKLLILRRENKLELAMLDGRLTATLEPEGLQVGDIVEFSYTITHHDPALRGFSEDSEALDHQGVAKQIYLREFWPASKSMRWRTTEGMQAPKISKGADGSELVIDMRDVERPKPPLGAPMRFSYLGSVELSEHADWAQLSGLLAPLWDKATTLPPGSPLRAEVAKIAASSSDPKVRANAALRLVQDRTRYVFLGMNDGGLVPANADQTWARRFGDCKGKTALLVAILRELDIDAVPILVNTTFGDGLDERLPMASWFDHAIVRARIGGKAYWLDGTRIGDRNIDDLTIPPYHWALPVQASGASLVKLDPPPLSQPGFDVTFKVDASKGPDAPAPAQIDALYRGEDAAKLRQNLASVDNADRDHFLRDFWSKADPWLDVRNVGEVDDPATGLPHLTVDGVANFDWSTSGDGGRFLRIPNTALGANISFKRQPGPNQDAPYAVAFPVFSKQTWQITLPAGGAFLLVGPDVDKTLAGAQLRRTSRIDGGVLTVETTFRAIEPEFPSAEAEADGVALRALATNGVSVAYKPGVKPQVAGGPVVDPASDQVAAAAGDSAAQFRLGRAYASGFGVPLDPSTAVAWFRKSAEQGYADGQVALANAFLTGRGLKEDDAQAFMWLDKAAAQNNAQAEVELGYVYEAGKGITADPAKSAEWYRKAADQNSALGQSALGTSYLFGRGVPRDPAQAMIWLQKAADQGLPRAESQLAAMYLSGTDVPRDVPRALTLARKAAAENDSQAERLLGFIYLTGLGEPVDRAQALVWLNRAAAHGDQVAKRQVQLLQNPPVAIPIPPVPRPPPAILPPPAPSPPPSASTPRTTGDSTGG